jgi:hypothetical protein
MQLSTDQKVDPCQLACETSRPTLKVMARLAPNPRRPRCYVCVQDEIYDQTGRHPAATVRVGISRRPYGLKVCERHLAQLQQTLPASGVWVVERYTSA